MLKIILLATEGFLEVGWCLVLEGTVLMRQLTTVISVCKSDYSIVFCIFAHAVFFHWITFSAYPECLSSSFKSTLAAFPGCFPSSCIHHPVFLLSNLFVFGQPSKGRDHVCFVSCCFSTLYIVGVQ